MELWSPKMIKSTTPRGRDLRWLLMLLLTLCGELRTLDALNDFDMLENFIKMGDKYYHIRNSLEHNWFDAQHRCRQLDAALVSFDSRNEFITVRDFPRYAEHNLFYWIAYNNWGETGQYYSVATGHKAAYTHWYENATYKADKKQCVAIQTYANKFAMHTFDCNSKFGYICELDKPLTINFLVA